MGSMKVSAVVGPGFTEVRVRDFPVSPRPPFSDCGSSGIIEHFFYLKDPLEFTGLRQKPQPRGGGERE